MEIGEDSAPGLIESILDINSSLPIPRFAIVDGIVGMEGNGPIPRASETLRGFDSLGTAVDVTATRLMKIDPWKIKYLKQASQFLGNIEEEKIIQVEEPSSRSSRNLR